MDNRKVDDQVQRAATLFHVAEKGTMPVTLAMKCAGFNGQDISDRSLQRRVRRAKERLENDDPIRQRPIGATVKVSSSSSLLSPLSGDDSTATTSVSTNSSASSSKSKSLTLKEKLPRKMRLTSNQAQGMRKQGALCKEENDKYFILDGVTQVSPTMAQANHVYFGEIGILQIQMKSKIRFHSLN